MSRGASVPNPDGWRLPVRNLLRATTVEWSRGVELMLLATVSNFLIMRDFLRATTLGSLSSRRMVWPSLGILGFFVRSTAVLVLIVVLFVSSGRCLLVG